MQLAVLQAMWSEFSQDSVAANNATRQFCTEALTIQAPHERMTDRWGPYPDALQGTTIYSGPLLQSHSAGDHIIYATGSHLPLPCHPKCCTST